MASESQEGPLCFLGELALTGTGASLELTTDGGACCIRTADEAARPGLDDQRAAVTFRHAHVGANAVEPDQVFSAVTETAVIVPSHPKVGAEQRKATCAARQALGDFKLETLLRSARQVANAYRPA